MRAQLISSTNPSQTDDPCSMMNFTMSTNYNQSDIDTKPQHQPLVSVITPVYNAQKFLKRAAKSVSLQNWNIEHIFINDKSTDNSLEILKEIQNEYENIIIIDFNKNFGPVIARNEGIKIAKGKYIAFLDADDFWMPNKLRAQIQFMEIHKYAATYTDYRHVSEDGRKISRVLSGFNKINKYTHHTTRFIGCLTVVINLELMPNFHFAQINPALRAEDFLAWQSIIDTHGAIYRCPHDLARYTIAENSRSSNKLKSSYSVWILYKDIERIPILMSIIFFIQFILFSIYKKIFFTPVLNRYNIDEECEWSLLPNFPEVKSLP